MDLTLVLTHGCNLACAYCFAGEKSARSMDRETGRRALELGLEEAIRDGSRRLDVAFFGGEPLLAWELLVELADEARGLAAERGVELGLSITTNGTLLTPERARWLGERDVHVGLSIDGAPEAQDLLRPDKGGGASSARVERGLDAAVAHVRALTAILVVDPRTVRWLAGGVARLVERGVRRVHLNPNWAAPWSGDDLDAWAAQYEAIARLWVARHRDGAPFHLSTIDPPVTQRVRGVSRRACGFGEAELAVAPSGRVYACARVVGEDRGLEAGPRASLGHVRGEVSCASRDACAPAALPDECRACALLDRCSARGCACAALECGGAPGAPGALACWHERMSIPIADAAAAELFRAGDPSFLGLFYELPSLSRGGVP